MEKSQTTYQTRRVSDAITRPADTTQYAAGDVISDTTSNAHFAFSRLADNRAMSGSIDGAIITIQANQATKPDLELWLFHTDIATVADNSAFAPTDTEILTFMGVIKFPVASFLVGLSGSGADGNIVQMVNPVSIPFKGGQIVSDHFEIYGQLVVRNAYTPISGEIFTVDLIVSID